MNFAQRTRLAPLLLMAFCATGCDSWNAPPDEFTRLQGRLAAFQEKHAALQGLIVDLQRERNEKVRSLRELGVDTAADLEGNEQAGVVAAELQAVRQRLELYGAKLAEYELALLKMTAAVREMERSRQARAAGIDEGDLDDLVEAVAAYELEFNDDALAAAVPVELRIGDVVEEELARPEREPVVPSVTFGSVQAQYHSKSLGGEPAPTPSPADQRLEGLRLAAKGDWPAALTLLAEGDDPLLAAAARRDRAEPAEAEKQVVIGDAWRMLATTEGYPREAFQERAKHGYLLAISSLSGEARARVEQQLSEL